MNTVAKKTILVVDDEPYIRQMVRSMLSSEYVVLEACDGKEAVEIACAKIPALILMDIMMPGMDGYAGLNTIKSDPTTKAIPVIMLTGVGFELNAKLSQEMGAAGYLTKPFKLEDLRNKINTLLRATCG